MNMMRSASRIDNNIQKELQSETKEEIIDWMTMYPEGLQESKMTDEEIRQEGALMYLANSLDQVYEISENDDSSEEALDLIARAALVGHYVENGQYREAMEEAGIR